MTDQEFLNALTGILRDVLLDDTIVLTKDTRRDEVAHWTLSTTLILSLRSK